MLLELQNRFNSFLLRHNQIENNQVWLKLRDQFESFLAVVRSLQLKTGSRENTSIENPDGEVVVNEQDPLLQG